MRARLISYSQPVRHVHSGEPGIMGLENIQDLVAYCARVSNPSNQANTKTTTKLLGYKEPTIARSVIRDPVGRAGCAEHLN